jgi:hypothetical protein
LLWFLRLVALLLGVGLLSSSVVTGVLSARERAKDELDGELRAVGLRIAAVYGERRTWVVARPLRYAVPPSPLYSDP